jgi:amidase
VTTPASTTGAVADALRDLHAVHERTHAVRWFDDEHALAAAAAVEAAGSTIPASPLRGLPITVKDWIDVAGFPCAGADPPQWDRRPDADATVVARLRAAGAVVGAKTSPWNSVTPNATTVQHPLDPGRWPGGSSSGDAVVTAAGAVRLGVGSDSGGSVRVPAAWCGVFGLKPTTGLLPGTGHFPRVGAWSDGRTTIGFLSPDLALIEAALHATAGPDGLDAGVPPVVLPARPESLTGLRVALLPADPAFPATPAVTAAATDTVERLVAAGMTPVEWSWPWLADSLSITARYWGRTLLSGADASQQLWDWDRFRRRYLATGVDLLVGPAVADVAPLRSAVARRARGDGLPVHTDDFVFTLPASLTGSPAISVPAGTDVDTGMPLAVQLVGRPWTDPVVLAAAAVAAG